jgi:hypothetical protein
VSCPGKLTQVRHARQLHCWVICCHNVRKGNKGDCKECSLHFQACDLLRTNELLKTWPWSYDLTQTTTDTTHETW